MSSGSAVKWKARLFSLVVLVLVAAALHAQIRDFSDPDSPYHIRHAWIERTQGFWRGDFPWAQFSAIGREASDLWYGFHVLLMPFTFGSDLVEGIRLAGLVVPFACLALVHAGLRRLEVRFPLFWTLVFAFATGDALLRITMVRPHPLSIGFALLLFAFACEERPPRWAVLSVAALFAWIHLALAWVPILIFLAVAVARRLHRSPPPFAWAGWTALGLTAGVLARPNPLGGLRLAAIQIVVWLARRSVQMPLDVGRELKPFGWVHFTSQMVPLTVLVGAALVLAMLDGDLAGTRVKRTGALLLLAVFAIMTFAVARRSNDFLVAFAAVFAGLAAGPAIGRLKGRRGVQRAALVVTMLSAAAIGAVRSVERFRGYASTVPGAERLRDAALWLRDHAAEGDVVFNVHWDQFAPLFFWNPRCRYVNGHDPIFLYAFDPQLYWVVHQLETDTLIIEGGRGLVRDTPAGAPGRLEDLHDALSQRFHSAWILAQKARTPRLVAFLSGQPRFRLAYETPGETVFRVLP